MGASDAQQKASAGDCARNHVAKATTRVRVLLLRTAALQHAVSATQRYQTDFQLRSHYKRFLILQYIL